MDIRAALSLPKRKGVFSPSRPGLSAAQIISEMNRWYAGEPQDQDMDWQIKGVTMSEAGRMKRGPWSCVECHGEARHEPTNWRDDYYIHQCPNWRRTVFAAPVDRGWESEQVDDGMDEWIKRHDSRSGGFGGL